MLLYNSSSSSIFLLHYCFLDANFWFLKSNNAKTIKQNKMEHNHLSHWARNKQKYFLGLVISVATLIIAFCAWYAFWVNFVENYEYGFYYNKFTGKIKQVEHTGWIIATPWEEDVHKIDTRPYQVSISANARILNAKLVKFNPEGIETFIEWHGRAAGDKLDNLREILKSYAFDRNEGTDCPFLKVVDVLAPHQNVLTNTISDSTSTAK